MFFGCSHNDFFICLCQHTGLDHHKIHLSNGAPTIESHVLHIPGYVGDVNLESVGESYQRDKSLSFSNSVFNQTNSSDYFSVFLTYIDEGCDFTNVYIGVE